MHPKAKQLWYLIKEIIDDNTLSVEDSLMVIGLLKMGETGLMMKSSMDEWNKVFPEEKKE